MIERIRKAEIGKVLRGAMAAFALAFFVAALCAPDAGDMLPGLLRLCTRPAQLTRDFFKPELGGVAAAMLNAALVGAIYCALLFLPEAKVTGATVLGWLLTVGFFSYGINLLNLLPMLLGTFAYAKIKRQPFGKFVNFAMFSTSLSPLVTQALFYYPNVNPEPRLTLSGILLALAIGLVVGGAMPALCAHSPNFHRGFDLYNAGPAAGILGFLLFAILYKVAGVEAPPVAADLGEGHPVFVNGFCLIVFGLCLLAGLIVNGGFKGYLSLLKETGYKADFTARYPAGVLLIHLGVYGLFILAYYNLIGATFTGVTMGAIFCMASCACAGATPLNVLPVMLGYFLISLVGSTPLNAQGMVVGLCFASGLAPVAGEYGIVAGVVAGMLHYCLVTGVPALHGGFCLYNGGFTAGIVCFLLVPVLEHFFKKSSEKGEQK